MEYNINQEKNSNSTVPTNIIYPLGDKFQRVSIPLIGEIACEDPITAEKIIEGYREILLC